MAGLSLVGKTDANPCPRVEVTVDGLHASTSSTVTVWRVADGQRVKVRGADAVSAVAAFFVVDYEAPLGRRVDYSVDVVGPTIPATLAANVTLDVADAWLQDPLAPTNATPIVKVPGTSPALDVGGLASLAYPMQSETVRVLGGTAPVALGGQRSVAQQVPFGLLTATADATANVRAILTASFPVLLRPPARWPGLPPLCFLAVAEIAEQPVDVLRGGTTTRWQLTGDLVQPPALSVVVPVWSYQDVSALWVTYQAAAATGRTYLDMMRNPVP